VRLLNVYATPGAVDLLWDLLSERTPTQSISHRKMPTREEHIAFVASRPYQAWYIVEAVTDCVDDVALVTENVGAAYLSRNREIGIGILQRHKGKKYGINAVRNLMEMHPGKYLANINPDNEASIKLFTGLGFKHIQNTYEKT